jgi:hypothetical protein
MEVSGHLHVPDYSLPRKDLQIPREEEIRWAILEIMVKITIPKTRTENWTCVRLSVSPLAEVAQTFWTYYFRRKIHINVVKMFRMWNALHAF